MTLWQSTSHFFIFEIASSFPKPFFQEEFFIFITSSPLIHLSVRQPNGPALSCGVENLQHADNETSSSRKAFY